MTSKAVMDDFIAQKTLGIIGVSRGGKKFGNMVFKELTSKGYELYPIHPDAEMLEGVPAYKDLSSVPKPVGGVIVIVPPAQTELVVRQAAQAGIKRIWMQQGSESETAIKYCRENGMSEVHGECIMMYTGKAGVHKFHRWVWKVLGKAPK